MGSYCDDTQYKIGLIPQRMLSLKDMRIAVPDQVVYRPATVYYPRQDYSRVGDGFISTEWIWDNISISRLSNLLTFLAGADWADVYIITDKRDGTYPNPDVSFGCFSAKMWKPILSGDEGVPVAQSPYAMQTVKIQFINMIEVSGYL